MSPGIHADSFDKPFITISFSASSVLVSRISALADRWLCKKKLNEFRLDSIESKLGTQGKKFNELTLDKFEIWNLSLLLLFLSTVPSRSYYFEDKFILTFIVAFKGSSVGSAIFLGEKKSNIWYHRVNHIKVNHVRYT